MNMRKWNWSTKTLRVKMMLSVLIMTLPLIGLLMYNNFYAIDVVRGQVADSYKNTLTLYLNLIDSNMNDVDAYMNTIGGNYDLVSLSQADTNDEYYMSKVYLFNKLGRDIPLYPSLSGFFVFESQRQDYMEVLSASTYLETDDVKGYVMDMIQHGQVQRGSLSKRWKHYRIGQDDYLIDIVQAGTSYLGAWTKTERLVSPLRSLTMGKEGEILFANDQGEPISYSPLVTDNRIELRQNMNTYYLSGSNQKYLVVGAHSNRGNFSLVGLIPDHHILANLPYLQQIIWFIMIAGLIFIPIGLYFIRRAFLVPLNRVLLAMKKVRNGDWSVRVDLQRNSDEFNLLGESFNSMMTEIQTLRVNVFEEQLSKQREELQRLQLQVNPHFFLNSLNIVYNLAKVKNNDLILEMTKSLIYHFRYLFRSNTSFVKLQNELDHIRNYLTIQCLRFPKQLTWTIDAPSFLMDVPIPPLVIQSFVENSIKYAVTLDNPISISIRIEDLDDETNPRIKICIRDTGPGFNDQVLQELRVGRNVTNDQGEHTGIWNVQRRLKLLYGEPVSILLDNEKESGGAVVEIILPVSPEAEGSK